MNLAYYLGFVHKSQIHRARAFREVAEGHAEDVAVVHEAQKLARQCDSHTEQLQPFAERSLRRALSRAKLAVVVFFSHPDGAQT